MIPKIVIQTSKNPIEPFVVTELKKFLSDEWEYRWFDDNAIIEFFISNPLEEFPDIIKVFNDLKSGPHKADLFRYYFMYINGGVFIDSDAMLKVNLDSIINDYPCAFFAPLNVDKSLKERREIDRAFNGFMGCSKNNKIVYDALKDLYTIDHVELENDYHIVCRNLTTFIHKHSNEIKVHLFHELCDLPGIGRTFESSTGITLLHHYYRTKVPNDLN